MPKLGGVANCTRSKGAHRCAQHDTYIMAIVASTQSYQVNKTVCMPSALHNAAMYSYCQ